jgi:hypothetical protein
MPPEIFGAGTTRFPATHPVPGALTAIDAMCPGQPPWDAEQLAVKVAVVPFPVIVPCHCVREPFDRAIPLMSPAMLHPGLWPLIEYVSRLRSVERYTPNATPLPFPMAKFERSHSEPIQVFRMMPFEMVTSETIVL